MQCLACLPVSRAVDVPRTLGVTVHARRLVDDGVLVRVRRGVIAGACVVERAGADPALMHELALRALLLAYPGAVASYESAALLHRLPLLAIPREPRLTRAAGAWRGGASARVRVAPLPTEHVTTVSGLGATAICRTVVDLARTTSLRAATVAGDAALRRGVTRSALLRTVGECEGWAEVTKARQAVAFFDPRAESALESLSRACMHESDVPAPELQKELLGASGRDYRVDFYWAVRRLVGEADGRAKYGDGRRTPEEVVWADRKSVV